MPGASRRLFWLWSTVAFIVLIPATFYEVLTQQLPRTVLFATPVYLLLAWGSYLNFKKSRGA